MLKRLLRHASGQRGIAALEFTLAVPVLTLLLMAIGEIGFAFSQYDTITKSIENGARYLSRKVKQNGAYELKTDYVTKAKNLVVYGYPDPVGAPLVSDLGPGNVTVSCSYGSDVAGGITVCNTSPATGLASVTVNVNWTYTPILGAALSNLSGVDIAVPLQATTVIPLI